MREDDEHLAPGTDVGGYVVEGVLGAGTMGVVYAAIHPMIGKRAAVKVLQPGLSDNPAAVERFIMEARAVNQIGHPNIVDIFAFGQLPDGRSYYVMDLLNGESLRRRLRRGPLHVSEAASVLDEIASALIAAHDKGIIHRDLKPDNVFMVAVAGRWPEVRILDWGLLKLSSTQSAVGGGKYRTLAGSLLGTPVYMSPEQARAADRVDFRTDIYALGVLAYEVLSGDVPFRRGNSIDTILAHQDEPVPPLGPRCPGLPDELVQLIEAMLAKDPDDRPTLAAVRAVIKRLRASKIPTMTAAGLQLPTSVPAAGPPEPSPHPTLVDDPADSPMHSMERTVPRASRLSKEDLPLPPPPQTPIGGETHGLVIPQTTLAGINPASSKAGLRLGGQAPAPLPGSPSQVGLPLPPHMQSQPSIPIPPGSQTPSSSVPNIGGPQSPYPQGSPSYAQGSQSPYAHASPSYAQGSQSPYAQASQAQAQAYGSQSQPYGQAHPSQPYGPAGPSQPYAQAGQSQPNMPGQQASAPGYAQQSYAQLDAAPDKRGGSRRAIVILIAALVVSAIGIILLVTS